MLAGKTERSLKAKSMMYAKRLAAARSENFAPADPHPPD
jgi:hypothetical protein